MDLTPHQRAMIQLRGCQRVLEFAVDTVRQWPRGRPLDPSHDLLLASFFARSTRTYEAIVKHLGNAGFGEQGAMLNRSLFEDMVDMHWTEANHELAAERILQHDRWARNRKLQVRRRFPELFESAEPKLELLSKEETQEFRQLFARHGSWTGLSLSQRVDHIEERWPSGGRRDLRFFHEWVNKLNSEILHPSSVSLARLTDIREEEGVWHFSVGSTTALLPQSLHCALWCYAQTLSLFIEEFELQPESDFAGQIYGPAQRAFTEDPVLRENEPN